MRCLLMRMRMATVRLSDERYEEIKQEVADLYIRNNINSVPIYV